MPMRPAPRPRSVAAAAAIAASLAAAGAADAQVFYGPPLGQPVYGSPAGAPISVATTRDDSWAERMVERGEDGKLDHDFGVVARGADTRTRLKIKNGYDYPVHIERVSTSCGCSAGEVDRKDLAPGEAAMLEISMDTKRFTRHKDSTVIVHFDRPRTAEVRIPVKMYVRTDVVLTPGGVDFGAVEKGRGAERVVNVEYAGEPGPAPWRITEVRGAGGALTAEIEETNRTAATASYRLVVTLGEDTPVGVHRKRLELITTDANSPRVPVLVEARVEDDITVRDVDLNLAAGQTKEFNVVLRGRAPFRIAGLTAGPSSPLNFQMKLPETTRNIHIVRMAFTAPSEAGTYEETFTVDVEGRDDPVTFRVKGRIAGS